MIEPGEKPGHNACARKAATLVLPWPTHTAILRLLTHATGERAWRVPVGRSHLGDGAKEYLAQALLGESSNGAENEIAGTNRELFLVRGARQFDPAAVWLAARIEAERMRGGSDGIVGALNYGVGDLRGAIWGAVVGQDDPTTAWPLDRLMIPGPGMINARLPGCATEKAPGHLLPPDHCERWSRSMGAWGPAGEQILRRLRELRILQIGAGRSGSLFAEWLASLGAAFTVVDPDKLALSDLGERGAVFRSNGGSVGQPKAEGLVAALAAGRDFLSARALCVPINSPEGLSAARRSEFYVTCCDRDSARVAVSVLASAYLRPHLDIATGIHFDREGRRTMGADVRLMLPGMGCLACFGGFNDYPGALGELAGHTRATDHEPDGWRRERAGSLRSLNQIAVGIGARLLEDLLAERIEASRWVQLGVGETADIQIEELPSPRARAEPCRFCALLGRGDDAVGTMAVEAAMGCEGKSDSGVFLTPSTVNGCQQWLSHVD